MPSATENITMTERHICFVDYLSRIRIHLLLPELIPLESLIYSVSPQDFLSETPSFRYPSPGHRSIEEVIFYQS